MTDAIALPENKNQELLQMVATHARRLAILCDDGPKRLAGLAMFLNNMEATFRAHDDKANADQIVVFKLALNDYIVDLADVGKDLANDSDQAIKNGALYAAELMKMISQRIEKVTERIP